MFMDLTTLKIIVSLAERGSLTAAAEELHLTQPALSIRVRKLQDELGVRLFEMRGRRVLFTRAGETVLAYARRFTVLESELKREMTDLVGLATGSVSIGTIDAASIYVLPHVFARFRKLHPAIDITLEIASTVPLVGELRAGRLDLVIGTLPVEHPEGLEVRPIYRERLLLIAPPGHPLARMGAVRVSTLAGEPFISFHEVSVTRRMVERAFARRGVSPRVTIVTDSPEAIKKLVAAGLGMAVLPERIVRDEIERGAVVALRVKGLALERRLGLIIPAGRYLSSPVRAFLGMLADGLRLRLPGRLSLGRDGAGEIR
jgi:DNA-binding transcriptional LysR family regulator